MSNTLPFAAEGILVPLTTPLHRFTVDEYYALAASGALAADARVELLDGLIYEMSPIGAEHAYTVERIDKRLLGKLLPGGWHTRMQHPIQFGNNEPQPDICVVRGELVDFRRRHPQAGDVALVIEVADATLAMDRAKAKLYAAAGIPEYWIMNLPARQLEVFRQPGTDDEGRPKYNQVQIFKPGAEVTLDLAEATLGPLQIDMLLPPAE